MPPSLAIGLMRERLIVQRHDAPTLSVSSLTRASTTATATTPVPHGYIVGDYVTFAGSSIAGWNAKVKIVTVPTAETFTFTVSGLLTTPATGTITVVYTSNATGGVVGAWRTLDTISAEMIPLGAMERLAIEQIESSVSYRFRVRARADLDAKQRVLWTPTAPPGSVRKTLEITGIIPVEDGRTFSFLEAADVTT